jgi:4-amino-4-deoxy-L-arabinose transferase-like glycosyltransferase
MPGLAWTKRLGQRIGGGDRGWSLVCVVLAVALSFVLARPFLGIELTSDEGGYAYVAQRWSSGQGHLYDDLWVSRPQGIFLVYRFIFWSLGTSTVAIHLAAWFANVGTMVVVWAFAREAAGRRVANLAVLIVAVTAGSPAIEGFTANGEVFMALPLAAAALVMLRGNRVGWPRRHLLGAGLLVGLATVIKPSAMFMLPAFILFIWLTSDRRGVVPVRRWVWLGTGFALAIVPAAVHGWYVGWDKYVFAVITYRSRYQSFTTSPPAHQLVSVAALAIRTLPLIAAVLMPVYVGWRHTRKRRGARIPSRGAVTTGIGIVWRPSFGEWPRVPSDDGRALLRLWLVASFAGVAIGGDWFPHYLVQAVAPASIWLAWKLHGVTDGLPSGPRWLVAATVAVLLLAPYHVVVEAKGNTDALTNAIFERSTYPGQEEIAAYLRDHSVPETPIYVAFYQAPIYFLADRPAAYPHLYGKELVAIPGATDDLIEMVRRPTRPLYLVDLGQVSPFADGGAAFWLAVKENYSLETIIHGSSIYRAKPLDVTNA